MCLRDSSGSTNERDIEDGEQSRGPAGEGRRHLRPSRRDGDRRQSREEFTVSQAAATKLSAAVRGRAWACGA